MEGGENTVEAQRLQSGKVDIGIETWDGLVSKVEFSAAFIFSERDTIRPELHNTT